MSWLILQMLFCLVLAALLGGLVGWWLRGLGPRDDRRRDEGDWRARLALYKHELDACNEERQKVIGRLEECEHRFVALARRFADAPEPAAPAPAAEKPERKPRCRQSAVTGELAPRRDDLKRIEGVGPKIEQLLNAGGILTWGQLAAATVPSLVALLESAGPHYRVHDPASWPQQASLAASGRWEELDRLQDQLIGGRA